jgi:hypothetical protein
MNGEYIMNIVEFAKIVKPDTKAILQTKTVVKMNKKDVDTKSIPNPHTEVFKINTIKVTMNADYQYRVNEQRIKEGNSANFEAKSMGYGQMVGNALLENNGQLYIKCIEENRIGVPIYVDAANNVIEYDELKPFIPSRKSNGQGVEEEIKVRNFKVDSVIGFELI